MRTRKMLSYLSASAVILMAAQFLLASPPNAQMTGWDSVLGLTPENSPKDFTVQEINCTSAANILWPGEKPQVTLQFTNLTPRRISEDGKVDIIQYGAKTAPGKWFDVSVYKIADIGSMPVHVDMPPNGFVNVTVMPDVPARFGGYLLAVDLGVHGRDFAAALVRTPKASPERIQFPTYALDLRTSSPEELQVFNRLGIKATRIECGFVPRDAPDYNEKMAEIDLKMKQCAAANVTAMLTIEQGGEAPMPTGKPRPFLSDDAHQLHTEADLVWLPKYDDEFQEWCKMIAGKYGWPKGPVNAMELWNEPWEGFSISGWGADMLRYRDLYTHMAKGIEQARGEDGVGVLIGGTCSSMNTEDKLFADGSDTFLKWLDFTSLHYQPMGAEPALVDKYIERQSPYGPVRVWDTESWIANSEDRVSAAIAVMRAQGLDRTNGVNHENVREIRDVDYHTYDGRAARKTVVHTMVTATGIAATQQYIGERRFDQIVYKNGLPWIFEFDGLTGPDDSTLVVVGDLSSVVDRDTLLFRGEQGRLSAASGAPGAMTLPDGNGEFVIYDYSGNPAPVLNHKITVPLNGAGYFLRTNGSKGSFARLLDAVKRARIDGYDPVDIIAHDMMAPIDRRPSLRLTITNILNRPVTGTLQVSLAGLTLRKPSNALTFAPWETREIPITITDGTASPDNTYALDAVFNAGQDGTTEHKELMHVNVIAHRTITVDGDLADWKGVLPTIIQSTGEGASLSEQAWLPFEKFNDATGSGISTVYLAYDDQNFYFAAKIADSTPYDGNIRFASRNDDDFFYPDKAYADTVDPTTHAVVKTDPVIWPEGVRHFSYRKTPELPSGNDSDNVQLAFGTIPVGQNGWRANPPGTMPKFELYKAVDYEYALNQVAPQYGGGTEIWRLLSPGMPYKHFFPRQPKSPVDGGPVDGKLAMRREGNTRIVEAAIPWTEIPGVQQLMVDSKPLRFSCRINDNKAPSYELAGRRSVSKHMIYAFHDAWTWGWANEVEYAFEK